MYYFKLPLDTNVMATYNMTRHHKYITYPCVIADQNWVSRTGAITLS